MNIAAVGKKRVCASCQARFFDLNRDPIICPVCQAIFHVPQPPPPRPTRAPWKFVRSEPVAAAEPDDGETAEKSEEETARGEEPMLDEDEDENGTRVEARDLDLEKRDRET